MNVFSFTKISKPKSKMNALYIPTFFKPFTPKTNQISTHTFFKTLTQNEQQAITRTHIFRTFPLIKPCTHKMNARIVQVVPCIDPSHTDVYYSRIQLYIRFTEINKERPVTAVKINTTVHFLRYYMRGVSNVNIFYCCCCVSTAYLCIYLPSLKLSVLLYIYCIYLYVYGCVWIYFSVCFAIYIFYRVYLSVSLLNNVCFNLFLTYMWPSIIIDNSLIQF